MNYGKPNSSAVHKYPELISIDALRRALSEFPGKSGNEQTRLFGTGMILTMREIFAPLPKGEYPMLNYELRHVDGILVLHPEGPLEAADFISITGQVDNYLEGHGKLHGVLIHATSFPGWKDFAAMLAHLKFLREHIQKIEKVAVVADGALANIMPDIANHFVHAQVQHFDFVLEEAAWNWINQTGKAQMNSLE